MDLAEDYEHCLITFEYDEDVHNLDFAINIDVKLTYVPESDLAEEIYITQFDQESDEDYQSSFEKEIGLLVQDANNGSWMLSNLLDEVHVPEEHHDTFIREIYGKFLANQNTSNASSFNTMNVKIWIRLAVEDEYDMEVGTGLILNVNEASLGNLGGADKSSLEALKNVISEEESDCPICLNEIPVGMELTKMPCSHVFHGHCIGIWLVKSRSCPMCRSELH